MKRNTIGIEDAVLLDNKLWFCLSEYRNLVSMDIETNETKAYTIPTSGAYVQKRAFASMELVGRKIYLIPFYERVIIQFDIDSEEFVKINLDSRLIENKYALFMGVGKYGEYLFVMGVSVPAILRVNTANNHVDYITDWCQKAEKLIFDFKEIYFRKQCVVLDNKLFVPFCNANAILEMDCISMETTIHSLGEKKQGYSGICFGGNSLWLSPRKSGDMVKWNLDTKQIDTIHIPGIQRLGNALSYIGIISKNNKKMLFPIVEKQTAYIEGEDVIELNGKFKFVNENESRIVFYETNSGTITIIDKETNKQFEIRIGKVDVDIEGILYENNIIVENAIIDIRDFMEYVNANL